VFASVCADFGAKLIEIEGEDDHANPAGPTRRERRGLRSIPQSATQEPEGAGGQPDASRDELRD
jgi:hypothetical protein